MALESESNGEDCENNDVLQSLEGMKYQRLFELARKKTVFVQYGSIYEVTVKKIKWWSDKYRVVVYRPGGSNPDGSKRFGSHVVDIYLHKDGTIENGYITGGRNWMLEFLNDFQIIQE